jgi:hypothetical protein
LREMDWHNWILQLVDDTEPVVLPWWPWTCKPPRNPVRPTVSCALLFFYSMKSTATPASHFYSFPISDKQSCCALNSSTKKHREPEPSFSSSPWTSMSHCQLLRLQRKTLTTPAQCLQQFLDIVYMHHSLTTLCTLLVCPPAMRPRLHACNGDPRHRRHHRLACTSCRGDQGNPCYCLSIS